MIKEELLEKLSYIEENCSFSSINDYQNLILFMYKLLENQENDLDILNSIKLIIKKMSPNKIHYLNQSMEFQKLFSFKLFNPLNNNYNYINNTNLKMEYD